MLRPASPRPRSVLSLALAVLFHAALFGVVVGAALFGPKAPPPEPPEDPGIIDWASKFPRRLEPSGGGGGPTTRGPKIPTPASAPEPVPVDVPQAPDEPETPVPPSDEGPTIAPGDTEDPTTGADGEPGDDPGGHGTGKGSDDGAGPGEGPGDGPGGGGAGEPAPEAVLLLGDMDPPVRIRSVEPEYPPVAKRAGVSGTVVLSCIIEEDGSVRVLEVARSVALLDEAAVEAVQQWRYRPARSNGRPLAVYQTVRVTFTLRN